MCMRLHIRIRADAEASVLTSLLDFGRALRSAFFYVIAGACRRRARFLAERPPFPLPQLWLMDGPTAPDRNSGPRETCAKVDQDD
ncbi:MAG: hypothetical protein EA339_03650 [Rhodobacteraceae bacterium]|nr:MAG: hypothetical protein EA339_03650 [Paracoccaceae bacterium]